jgi:hypothetical protein
MELLSSIALLEDVPAEGLVRGQVGTVVEVYDADHFEVEFVDAQGATYGLTTLESRQIMPLLHSTARAA